MTRRPKFGETLRELSRRFPKAFVLEAEGRRPLKRDIFHDLWAAAADLGYDPLRHAYGQYVGGVTYLETLREGAQRFGLYGSPAGLVTDHDEEQAREKLARILERRRERLTSSNCSTAREG
jgi:sRNA-binding protein